ncbi:Prominin-2 [Merluccius polli]|uniref:Prominin-2 n=1 Tax=Merluccius polli TaxID=89951 RepID=A0AA47M8K0_MERPO|nr:Prominin-2 [Merluccius polli]
MAFTQSTKLQLKSIETHISQAANIVPLTELTELSASLDKVQQDINKNSKFIQTANHTKWGVCVAICCLVLLVVVCNILGLLLGPAGLRPKEDPSKRSCTTNCGGTFLMIGAGFSFIFSWLFMLLVLLLFLLGGNLFTLVCKPWDNGELLQFIQESGLLPPLPNNVTLSEIHRDCRKNMPLWSTLHLSESANLDELLNVSKYTEDILQNFDSSGITLSTITLLSPEVQNQLRDFPAKLKELNFTAASEQGNLSSHIDELQAHGVKTNETVATVSSDVGAAQDFLNTDTTLIVKAVSKAPTSHMTAPGKVCYRAVHLWWVTHTHRGAAGWESVCWVRRVLGNCMRNESRAFLNCQMQLFDAYVHWAKLMITEELGRCRPVSGAVDTAALLVCSNMVESLNAFWFSLGWCMIFFIPSIICSIKLSKYYRKMKLSDEFKRASEQIRGQWQPTVALESLVFGWRWWCGAGRGVTAPLGAVCVGGSLGHCPGLLPTSLLPGWLLLGGLSGGCGRGEYGRLEDVGVALAGLGLPLEDLPEQGLQQAHCQLRGVELGERCRVEDGGDSEVLGAQGPEQVQVGVQVSVLGHLAQQAAEDLLVEQGALLAELLGHAGHTLPLAAAHQDPQGLEHGVGAPTDQQQLHLQVQLLFMVCAGPMAVQDGQGPLVEWHSALPVLTNSPAGGVAPG